MCDIIDIYREQRKEYANNAGRWKKQTAGTRA